MSTVFSVIGGARLAAAVSSCLVAAVLYFFALEILATHVFRESAIYDLRLFVAIWLILWCLEDLNAETFRGLKQFHLAVVFKKLAPNTIILAFSSVVFFAQMDIALQDYLAGVLFAWFISLGFSSWALRRYLSDRQPDESPPVRINALLLTGAPLWFTATITFALPHLDLWVLASVESAEKLALYGAASRLILVIAMPLFIIQAVTPPLIAEAHSQNRLTDIKRELRAAAAIAFYPGLLVCLVYFVAGDVILTVLFGEFYSEAALVLNILTVGVMCRLFAASSQSILTMTGNGKTAMMISMFSGVLIVSTCLYAGGRYGMVGVAAAATFSVSVHNFLNFLFARVRCGLWVFPWFSYSHVKSLLKAS